MRERDEEGKSKRDEGRAETKRPKNGERERKGKKVGAGIRWNIYAGILHLSFSFVSLFTFLPFLDRISTSASPTFDFRERRFCRENCRYISNGLVTTISFDRQHALFAPELLRKL